MKYLQYKDVVPDEPCLPGVSHYYIRIAYDENCGPEISVLITPYINGPGELPWYEYFLSISCAKRIKFRKFPKDVRDSILFGLQCILSSDIIEEKWRDE